VHPSKRFRFYLLILASHPSTSVSDDYLKPERINQVIEAEPDAKSAAENLADEAGSTGYCTPSGVDYRSRPKLDDTIRLQRMTHRM
jgi:hypothetical protein